MPIQLDFCLNGLTNLGSPGSIRSTVDGSVPQAHHVNLRLLGQPERGRSVTISPLIDSSDWCLPSGSIFFFVLWHEQLHECATENCWPTQGAGDFFAHLGVRGYFKTNLS